ncbi:arginine deiminase [Clostridium estertheticum]|uniref:arginine deiminase n=1 Tax=Clostridium estertheticum TaxID=238834 RepID=UPI001C0AA141|nr:arginine deiminase [Clostridium estertheticum]MBU3216782.1 arginine deiminase [Clostridium estertheticum]WAG54256.1 arginine deiminase [Clostridium estertheticum]
MDSFINVTSEIGKLNKVMLHRPGREIENLTPELLERLLFDDIPYLEVARKEHDIFAKLLKENDVEVLYLEELVTDALEDDKVKKIFLQQFLQESHISNKEIYKSLYAYLMSKPTREMIDILMAGVRKNDVDVKEMHSLRGLIGNNYPFYLDPMPNLYFTRDPGASIGNGITINTMQTEARRRETLFLEFIHRYHKSFKEHEVPLWYDRTLPNNIEGGDELILSATTLAIGCSQRTSPEAIEVVARNLFAKHTSFEKVLVLEIPSSRAFMHLDTVFTMVDYDKFTIHPEIEGPLNVFEITKGLNGEINIKQEKNVLQNVLKSALNVPSVELIRCGGGDSIVAAREQWNDGSNTLAIAPGKVITYERNYITNEILAKRGITVITMPSAELSRGRGGPRCMSMPLNRDNL